MNIDKLVFAPGAPLKNAELFATARYFAPERPLLLCQGNTFFAWNGACWPELEDATLRSELYRWFGEREYTADDGGVQPFNPTRAKIENIRDALGAFVHLPASVNPPAWIDGTGAVPASELVACTNGLVHVPTRELHALTPNFYVHHSVPFAYAPDAPLPERWLRFLGEVWPDDPDAIVALQEVFGYLLSGDTSLQKIFLFVGPKRSGKGTIMRVFTAMAGAHHVAGPTLAGIGTNFGLSPLIGKPVAVVSDARLRGNDAIVTERLLSISGEDAITIDRKYREPWTGRLPTRFVILTNELPRLTDSSGALASRFVILTMTESFYGRENPKLTEELTAELPGIFNWSLDGLDRLRARGHFLPPQSSAETVRELEDLGSPIAAFVRDRCDVGPGCSVTVDQLFQAWRDWCEEHGRDRPGTSQVFARDLRSVLPGIKVTQPRVGDSRERRYEGIALAEMTIGQNAFHRVPNNELGALARDGTRSSEQYEEAEWMR